MQRFFEIIKRLFTGSSFFMFLETYLQISYLLPEMSLLACIWCLAFEVGLGERVHSEEVENVHCTNTTYLYCIVNYVELPNYKIKMNKEKKELPGDLKLSSQEIELYVTNADFERIKSHANLNFLLEFYKMLKKMETHQIVWIIGLKTKFS